MDAAVFVLTADPPVSASERDLLDKVAALSVMTFAVLNKADYLDERGLAEAAEFTRRVLGTPAIRARCIRCPGAPPSAAVTSALPRSRRISPRTCQPRAGPTLGVGDRAGPPDRRIVPG